MEAGGKCVRDELKREFVPLTIGIDCCNLKEKREKSPN